MNSPMNSPLHVVTVTYRGRPVSTATVNARMDTADPGTWGLDHPLIWSCRVSARRCADMIAAEYDTRYDVTLTEVER